MDDQPALTNGPHDHDHLEPEPTIAEMSDAELFAELGDRLRVDSYEQGISQLCELGRRFDQYLKIVERLPKDEDGNPQIEGWIADRHGPVRVHLTLTSVEKDNPRNMFRVPYATSWTLHPTAEAALAATNQPVPSVESEAIQGLTGMRDSLKDQKGG